MIDREKPSFGGFTRPLDDIQRAKVKKTLNLAMSEKDLMLECARDFGFLLADGQKNGLPLMVAFEAAKNHFRVYGKAMMEFSEIAENSGLRFVVESEAQTHKVSNVGHGPKK